MEETTWQEITPEEYLALFGYHEAIGGTWETAWDDANDERLVRLIRWLTKLAQLKGLIR